MFLVLLALRAWSGCAEAPPREAAARASAERVAPPTASALTPDLVLSGTTAGERFGRGVAAADLDLDGRDDLLITSPAWSNPEAMEGRISVFPGAPAGPASAPATSVETNVRWGGYEQVVTLDADGDALADVVVARVGQVVAFYGSSPAAAGWSATGASGFGSDAVARAGDVDGDGYDDLVVGETLYGSSWAQAGEGRVQLFRGGPAGLERAPSWSFESNQQNGWAGASAASAGDVDGDGYDDLIVGGPYGGTGGGVAWLFRGGPAGLSAAPAWSATGSWNAVFGYSVAGVGDVNGDGYDDLAVGAPDAGYGTVYVWFGGPAGPAVVADQVLMPGYWTLEIGVVGRVGDLDGDGLDDLLVRSETALGDDHAFLYYGDPTGVIGPVAAFSGDGFYGPPLGADVNGDGLNDLVLAAAYQAGSPGVVSVFFGGSDRDADGTQDAEDCLPDDPRAHPGTYEIFYDGVDGDCLGGDDFDADHDGHAASAYGGDDCDDEHEDWHLCTEVSGTCPGSTVVTVGGMTPGAPVEIYASPRTGYGAVPAGACAGAGMDLGGRLRARSATADASGLVTWSADVPANLCGLFYVAVDLATCEVSVPTQGP